MLTHHCAKSGRGYCRARPWDLFFLYVSDLPDPIDSEFDESSKVCQRQMHFFIYFSQERRETSEICVEVNEFPRLSFLPVGCSGKILGRMSPLQEASLLVLFVETS